VIDSIGTVGTATVTVNPAPAVVRSGGCASADGSAWPQLLAGALALLLRPRRKSAS
jgi:MYXO-CTERM domain-containing protein